MEEILPQVRYNKPYNKNWVFHQQYAVSINQPQELKNMQSSLVVSSVIIITIKKSHIDIFPINLSNDSLNLVRMNLDYILACFWHMKQ